jgi:hypothetical protein
MEGNKMKWNAAERNEMKYNFHIIVWIFYDGTEYCFHSNAWKMDKTE